MVLPSSTTKGAHLEATQKHITVVFSMAKKSLGKYMIYQVYLGLYAHAGLH